MEAELSSKNAGLSPEGQLLVLVLDVNTEQVISLVVGGPDEVNIKHI